MKFIKIFTKEFIANLIIVTILFSFGIVCFKEKKIEMQNNLENSEYSKRRKFKKIRSSIRMQSNPPILNTKNLTLGNTLNTFINKSIKNIDMKTFIESNKNSKFHLLFDMQLEEIFLILKNNRLAGINDFRSFYEVFFSHFKKCDKENKLFLNENDLIECLKNDPYLSLIQPPDKLYAVKKEYITDSKSFGRNIFLFADNYDIRGLNFYDYVELRLIAFAWRKCSVNIPFIDESSFECAIQIISGSKIINSNTSKRIFDLALELTSPEVKNVRSLDFIVYYLVANTIRLYGKINPREDMDATRNQFNVALYNNILPTRYSQSIIEDLFRLVKSNSNSNNGIDLYSFFFYDKYLRIFYQGFESNKRWFVNETELNDIINFYEFPGYMYNYLKQVPQANYTADSYNLRTHINPALLSEDDYFNKFLEIKSSFISQRHNTSSFDGPLVVKRLFKLLDSDMDGYLSFYDFGCFIQTFYIYNKADNRHDDRVLVGNIYNIFTEYYNFPIISEEFRERSKRFSMIDQDLYIDPYHTLAIIRMEDYVHHYLRKSDPTTVKEIDISFILNKINLGNYPSESLSSCKRGKDDEGLPKFDWECSIIQAITKILIYLENSRNLKDIKTYGFNLTYTRIDTAPSN